MAKKQKKEVIIQEKQDDTVSYINALALEGITYRDKFTPTWNEIIGQLRCVLPSEYKDKEGWQTKVYIPMQAKGSDVIVAYFDKMLFGVNNWFSMYAGKTNLLGYITPLQDLIRSFLDNGRFTFAKNFALEESINIGTSFIKVVARRDKSGFDFIGRSAYSIIIDAGARNDFYKSRFAIDVYRKDIDDIINEAKMPNSDWDKDAVEKLIAMGAVQCETERAKKSGETQEEVEMRQVRNIDGTGTEFVLSSFADVEIFEFWGKAKVLTETTNPVNGKKISYYTYEDKCIKVANRCVVLAEDKNEYGSIPIFPVRTKVRNYDFYGKGFFMDTRGIQDLANSTCNMGFDSIKISGMDIIMLDKSRINDQSSIVYEPLAIWDVKDPQNVRLTRSGISALRDVLNGLAFLDGMHQDTTGATRQAQGTQSIPGVAGGSDATLGEFQYKLQMVDQRFLKQAKFIEDDLELPMLRFILKQIYNPNIISQECINKKLGLKEVPINDPATGQQIASKNIPVLDRDEMVAKLNEYDKSGNWTDPDIDFTILGLNQFVEKVTVLQKIDGLINRAVQNPSAAPYTNLAEAYKRWYELSDIPDWESLYMPNAPVTPPPPPVMPNGKVPNSQMDVGLGNQGQRQPNIPMV